MGSTHGFVPLWGVKGGRTTEPEGGIMYVIEAVKYFAEKANDDKKPDRKVKWIEVLEDFDNDFVSGEVESITIADPQPVPGMLTLEVDMDTGLVMLAMDQPIEIVWSSLP